ncbi:hypothetical protein A9Q81_00110 [Gammaproteobacteria bacterium 42_54_T18]|nr:hypothetical protein A9Q81_00110 [Gammaproteobacteria bacterium 42_54_T18]
MTHHGAENRAVYVGTTSCFGRRIEQHYYGYIRGNRTIWKVSGDEDVYTLMTAFNLRNYVRHFQQLAKQNRIWASTTLDRYYAENLLLPNQEFDQEWRRFLKDEYLPNIGVWALKIRPYDAKKAALIETALQKSLVSVFNLGRFFNRNDLSVLGKIEFNKYKVKISDAFLNVPDLDDASKLVFSTLAEKVPPKEAYFLAKKQLSSVIDKRLEKQKERLRQRQEAAAKYPRQGVPWSMADLEKLRVMVVGFEMKPEEIAEHLERSPISIAKKIDLKDRLSLRQWRSSTEELVSSEE